jgi:hypothetical protein
MTYSDVLGGLLAGGVGGIASGFLGITSGGILVPLLVLILGHDQHVAQGISLVAQVVPTSSGNFIELGKEQQITVVVDSTAEELVCELLADRPQFKRLSGIEFFSRIKRVFADLTCSVLVTESSFHSDTVVLEENWSAATSRGYKAVFIRS